MERDKSRLRQRLHQLEQSRWAPLREILAERGLLRRGAFVTLERKCGKPNCRCATGEGHPAKYLSIKQAGRTRMVYVPAHLELRVSEQAGRYRRFRKARALLAKLSKHSLELIDELEKALETTTEIVGKKAKQPRPRLRRPRNKD